MGANAVTTVPVYVAGEVLTAADLNITNSGIPVFASSVERDAAFGGTGEKTLAEGQYAFLEDTNATQFYDGATWQSISGGVVQVKSTVLTTATFTTTSATYTDLTGLAVTITPTSASNTILVITNIWGGMNSDAAFFNLNRGGTLSTPVLAGGLFPAQPNGLTVCYQYLDSPATTSAITYTAQVKVGAGTFRLNTTASTPVLGTSVITAMEIKV
jgi:hypothetical protein